MTQESVPASYHLHEVTKLEAEIERLTAEKINLLNWLNTHYPHVAIAWARKDNTP